MVAKRVMFPITAMPLLLVAACIALTLAGCDTAPREPVPPPRDTVAAAGTEAPSSALPPDAVDSLRADLARLTAAVEAARNEADSLQQAVARITPAAPGAAETTLREARDVVQSYGLKVFFTVVVLILASLLIKGSIYLLERLSEKSAARRLFYKRLVPILRIALWLLVIIYIVRGIFEVGTAGLMAAAAAIGVGIGFAAQDFLKNIIGGLVIVFDQPFQVGDKISVGGTYGEVSNIGLRSTRIVTPDDNLVSVPNAQIADGQVANANAGALDCQVVTDLYLPGYVDDAKAKRIAYEAATTSPYVYLDKPVVVLVRDEFKETFLTRLMVKAYVLDTRYEGVFRSDVTERARAEFRRQGLVSPLHGARAYVDLSVPPPADGDGIPDVRGRDET